MNVDPFFWQVTGSRSLRSVAAQVRTASAQLVATLALWQERGRQRRALARLELALLHDIGRSQHEVARECAKPVWRA